MTIRPAAPTIPSTRPKRFSKTLKSSGVPVLIPDSWEHLPAVSETLHEEAFLKILKKHGLECSSPVPLVGRYSKARRWSKEELEACLMAHDRGIPVALMSAALNRNPQDIIFRLLDERHGEEGGFKEVGLKNSKKWNDELLTIGRELFDAGLTAWRVAALFGMDFEGVEKLLYQGRKGYGHVKKNPFAICTDHKQVVNLALIKRRPLINSALEAFAGEGRFAKSIVEVHPAAKLICIEQDEDTFKNGTSSNDWSERVNWRHSDNIPVLHELIQQGSKFDLIDLDPFVSCRDQLDLVWPLLTNGASLFITFGGEYRRSFIGTNRKAIQRRYGWLNETLSNSDYLELIPSYFLGWVAQLAARNGFTFNVDYCVRYPNNCRFWTTASAASKSICAQWLESKIVAHQSGYLWKDLEIPRFAEVRYRTAELGSNVLSIPRPKASIASKINNQLELSL